MESGQKKFHKYLMLNRISRLFSIHLDLRKLADEIILRMAELLGADRGVYHVQLNVHDPANLIIRNRPTGATLPLLEDQYQRWVHEHRQPLLVADAQDDFRFTYTPTMEKRCLMLGPLLSGDTVIGYLRAEAETPGVFNYEDLQLFSILAEMSAGAVDNARLYRRAQELAITDGLTGLVLRRFFYQRFEEELGRFHEQRTPFTLVMLDLDHFKLINDRYLHAVGDQVLAQIAEILRLEARVADVLCRFGGEEFAILLPNTPLEGGMVMAERIRKQVERKKFKAREIFFNVTISAGLGECPQHGRDIKTLIRTADQALYRAKHQGRNQVVVAVKEPGHAAG
jgi:diguanylate cyclase (GGDEF)-like protein